MEEVVSMSVRYYPNIFKIPFNFESTGIFGVKNITLSPNDGTIFGVFLFFSYVGIAPAFGVSQS